MVEAIFEGALTRGNTPTPTRHFFTRLPNTRDLPKDSIITAQAVPDFYETSLFSNSPGLDLQGLDSAGGDIDPKPESMDRDARGSRPNQTSMPDQAKARSDRRRPRSQSASSHRPPGPRPLQATSSHPFTPLSPPHSSENIHGVPMAGGYQGSHPQYTAPSPYVQRGTYPGQYTMSPPAAIAIAHTPSPPFAYSHGYHHPGLPDGSMISQQSIHANYQPMLPHAPVYPYQHHSPADGGSVSFSGSAAASPIYSHHQVATSPPPSGSSLSQPMPAQSPAYSSSYVGSSQYSLRYPSPMGSPQYNYAAQSFPASSPMYQSPQFAPSPYAQHFPSTQETERQGTWWYLPHTAPAASQPQYESVPPTYQSHYRLPFSPIAHQEADHSYDQAQTGAGVSNSAQVGMFHQASQFPSERARPPSPAPRASGLGPPPPSNPDTSVSSGSANPNSSDKPVVRRSYHPNPPAHRSEWVMWAGNVPSDVTHDELWRFFHQPVELPAGGSASSQPVTGVLSIFLISRSSCAFVNFESESYLHEAIGRFNGKPLRPNDPRCPRLVCRVRRKDDDLKAGVGGQRGMGMHTRWIKESKGKQKGKEAGEPSSDVSTSDDPPTTPSSSSDQLTSGMAGLLASSDEEGRMRARAKHSSSSGSFASTNSSVLSRYFPKRYFILKSLTQFDLDLSVQEGVWATQKHNEGILDQAYRTSREVYLIFGVNKSGEFYGYARMAGPVRRGERRVSWATRTSDSSPSSARSTSGRPLSTTQSKEGNMFFSPTEGRLVDGSPADGIGSLNDGAFAPPTVPLDDPTTPGASKRMLQSAPAVLGKPHHNLTWGTPGPTYSLDQYMQHGGPQLRDPKDDDFHLDHNAPIRAVRNEGPWATAADSQETGMRTTSLQAVAEEEEKPENDSATHEAPDALQESQAGGSPKLQVDGVKDEAWGESFKIEWICTDRLPFYRTRQIRNPWNHDREVKVSRDGTELEPSVGQKLLEEWGRLQEEIQGQGAVASKTVHSAKSFPALPVASVGSKASRQGEGAGLRDGPSRS